MPVCRCKIMAMQDNIFHDGHRAEVTHKLVIIDRDKLTVEFRDHRQFGETVSALRAGGFMIFSMQPPEEPAPWVEPEPVGELDDLPRRGRKRKLA